MKAYTFTAAAMVAFTVTACAPQPVGGGALLQSEAAALTRLCVAGGGVADLKARGYEKVTIGFAPKNFYLAPEGGSQTSAGTVRTVGAGPCGFEVLPYQINSVGAIVARELVSLGFTPGEDNTFSRNSTTWKVNGIGQRNSGAGINLGFIALSKVGA